MTSKRYYCLTGSKVECWLGTCTKKRYINYAYYLWLKFAGYSIGIENE